MTKVYLHTCWMSGDVSNKYFSMANNVKQNNARKTIVTHPVLWLQHKELRIKIEHFSDAPMHMLFLGVTKHFFVHVDCLFGNKNSNYQQFCRSNLAKISLLIGVPLLILQTLTQYQPQFGNLLSMLHFHACLWFILGWWKISTSLLTEQM